MTRDEEVLRRVLRSAADSIEPASDGLARIRQRVAARRRTRAGWLRVNGTGLAGFGVLRLQATGVRLADLVRAVVQPLLDWFGADGPRHARHRPVWRRPAVAIGAVVFIAAAAGVMASGLPAEIGQNSTPSSAAQAGGAFNGHGGNGPDGNGKPYGSAPGAHGRASASPSPSCSASARSGKNPGHTSPSPSATPSPTPSATPSPTASPTESPSPTPSATASPFGASAGSSYSGDTGGGSSSAGSGGTQALSASRLADRGSAPQASPSPSPTCSPG